MGILECRDLVDVTSGDGSFITKVGTMRGGDCFLKTGYSEIKSINADHAAFFASYVEDGRDSEHDRAYAVSFPIVEVNPVVVGSQWSSFEAWIRPGSIDDFLVPNSDFNPFEDADRCDREYCDEDHYIVDYMPDQTKEMRELYSSILGQRICIEFGRGANHE